MAFGLSCEVQPVAKTVAKRSETSLYRWFCVTDSVACFGGIAAWPDGAQAVPNMYVVPLQVLAASFPDIDSDIDAREYAFPLGERDPGFKGGHHIEALLYR